MDKNINGNMRRARIYLKFSQQEIANRLGLQRNSINLIENGKRTPSERTIREFCNQLNVNRHFLENGGSDSEILNNHLVLQEDEVTTFLKSCLDTYKKLDEPSKAIIKEAINEVLDNFNKEIDSIKKGDFK